MKVMFMAYIRGFGILGLAFLLNINDLRAAPFKPYSPPSRAKTVLKCAAVVGALVTVVGLSLRPEFRDYRLPHGGTRIDELHGGASVPALPPQFFVKGNISSWGHSFRIVDEGHLYGTVKQNLLSWSKSFRLEGPDGELLANGTKELLSWGVKINFQDANGASIGAIHEIVSRSLFKVTTEYKILDAEGREVAKSEKLELADTDFTMTDSSGTVVATLHRDWLNWPTDTWSVELARGDKFDSRLALLIAAFKSSEDADRKAESSSKE